MNRFLLSFDLPERMSVSELQSTLLKKLTCSKNFVLPGKCLLVETDATLACVNTIIQDIGLDNYVLVLVARGKWKEGFPSKMFIYPHIDGVNDTIND